MGVGGYVCVFLGVVTDLFILVFSYFSVGGVCVDIGYFGF